MTNDRAGTGPVDDLALTVRQTEARRLVAELDGLGQHSKVIELVGEPGAGKTRLLSVLTTSAAGKGMSVRRWRCKEAPAGDGLPPWGDFATMPHWRSLIRQSSHNGFVMILDDFQWADDNSLEFVEHIVRWPIEAPLLLVVAQRPRQASPRLRSSLAHGVELGTAERVQLDALSLRQAAELLGVPETDPRLPALHRESFGNPLYLLALAQADGGGRPGTPGLRNVEPGQQWAALLMGEFASLSPAETAVAAAAAVLVEPSDMAVLAEVAELDAERTAAAVAALDRRDLLRPVGPSSSHVFRHSVLRDLVYTTSAPAWRASAHRRALRLLRERGAPPTVLARHVELSLELPETGDVSILMSAAEAMANTPAAAAHWIKVAGDALPADPEQDGRRALLALDRAEALGVAGRLEEGRDLFRETLDGTPALSPAARVSAVASYALLEALLGRCGEASRLCGIELGCLDRDPPVEAVNLTVVDAVSRLLGGQSLSVEQLDDAVRLAQRHDDRVAEAGALAACALRDTLTAEVSAAAPAVVASARILDSLPDIDLVPRLVYLAVLGWAEIFLGRYAEARGHFARGVAVARRTERVHLLPALLCGLSNAEHTLGAQDKARLASIEAKDVATMIGAPDFRGLAAAFESLGFARAYDEVDEDAMALAEEAVATLTPESLWRSVAAVGLAGSVRVNGDPLRCLALLMQVGRGADMIGLPAAMRPVCYEMLALAATDVGDLRAADEWAERAEATAVELGLPLYQAHALAARAHVLRARPDPVGAMRLYQEAARVHESAGLRSAQAKALISAAQCAAAADLVDDAAMILALAREVAGRDALALHRRIDEQQRRVVVRQAKQRQQPTPTIELSTLTSREYEVAKMAGAGERNQEIATKLSLSPRTVEVHLTRVYRKLNIRSRAALARMMAVLD